MMRGWIIAKEERVRKEEVKKRSYGAHSMKAKRRLRGRAGASSRVMTFPPQPATRTDYSSIEKH